MQLLTRFSFHLTFIVALLVALSIISVITMQTKVSERVKQFELSQQERIQQRFNELYGTVNDLTRKGHLSDVRHEIFRLATDPLLKYIALVDNDDTILYSSRIDYEEQPLTSIPGSGHFISMHKMGTHRSHIEFSENRDAIYVFYPLNSLKSARNPFAHAHAELIAHYDFTEAKDEIIRNERLNSLTTVAWYFSVIILLGIVLYINMNRRLAKIIKAAEVFSQGNLTSRIEMRGSDEFSAIARTFNTMADALQEQQETILQQKKAFETIYEKTADAIFLLKAERFEDCNEAALTLFGAQDKQSLLQEKNSQMQAKSDPFIQQFVQAAKTCRDEGRVMLELSCQRLDKSVISAEVVMTRLIINSEETIHVALRDISKRKADEKLMHEQQQQLIQQSRFAQMGEMLAMIAHQWRQPLAAISSTATLLQTKILLNNYDKELFEEQLTNITDFSQHLSVTIDDFRDFFKAEKEHAAVIVPEVIEDALKIVEVSFNNRNIALRKEFLYNETIFSYPNELKQVILNLLANAKDIFSDKQIDKPEISIRVYSDNAHVCIDIADNGGGIPEAIIDKIFDPYFTTKENLNGTGLGLYMSKKIIEEHCKGSISVKNINGGACFTIALPRDNPNKSS